MRTFEQMTPGYRNLWRDAVILDNRKSVTTRVANAILADKKRYYLDVQKQTGVPWFWIACVHHRENGGKWDGVLHNGEAIINTGRKTTLVPAGRGPFKTWREAAIDALTATRTKQFPHAKELHKVKSWPIERCLYEFERYNGWGYLGTINSPYVWAATSKQQRGKYVKDRVFDADHWDQQLGCAAVLKALMKVDDSIAIQLEGERPVTPDPTPPTQETYQQKRDRLIRAIEDHTGGKVAILFD